MHNKIHYEDSATMHDKIHNTSKKRCLNNSLNAVVLSICMAIVFYESFTVFKTYLDDPTGTSITFKEINNVILPIIELCPDFAREDGFIGDNFTKMDAAKLDYYILPRFPLSEELYESFTFSLNEFIDEDPAMKEPSSGYDYTRTTMLKMDDGNYYPVQTWAVNERYLFGTCYALDFANFTKDGITPELIKIGVKKNVVLRVFKKGQGMLPHLVSEVQVRSKGKQVKLKINLEERNLINSDDSKCSEDENIDKCMAETIEKISWEELGCLRPIMGKSDERTCRNTTTNRRIREIFRDMVSKSNIRSKYCGKPCRHIQATITKNGEEDLSGIDKNLQQLIIEFGHTATITDQYKIYSFMQMVAEVGGFVGLFLGFSVLQITELFNKYM